MKNRSTHDKVLIGINYMAGVMATLAACMVDSSSPIPTLVLVVSMLWLALFAYVNGYIL